MGRRRRLEPHLTVDELARRYRAAKEPHERSRWQILVALQARPDLNRSTTLFPWWPQRIKKRQGPKTT